MDNQQTGKSAASKCLAAYYEACAQLQRQLDSMVKPSAQPDVAGTTHSSAGQAAEEVVVKRKRRKSL